MLGIICIVIAMIQDFADMHIGKGINPNIYGNNHDEWHRMTKDVEQGKCTWTSYISPTERDKR